MLLPPNVSSLLDTRLSVMVTKTRVTENAPVNLTTMCKYTASLRITGVDLREINKQNTRRKNGQRTSNTILPPGATTTAVGHISIRRSYDVSTPTKDTSVDR